MAKSPREKVGSSPSPRVAEQALKDREGAQAVGKGGGMMAKHSKHHKEDAEKAEMASYKLNKRSKF